MAPGYPPRKKSEKKTDDLPPVTLMVTCLVNFSQNCLSSSSFVLIFSHCFLLSSLHFPFFIFLIVVIFIFCVSHADVIHRRSLIFCRGVQLSALDVLISVTNKNIPKPILEFCLFFFPSEKNVVFKCPISAKRKTKKKILNLSSSNFVCRENLPGDFCCFLYLLWLEFKPKLSFNFCASSLQDSSPSSSSTTFASISKCHFCLSLSLSPWACILCYRTEVPSVLN